MLHTRRAVLQGMAAAAAASSALAQTTGLSGLRAQQTLGIRLGAITGCFGYDTPPAPGGTRVEGLISKYKTLGLKHVEIQGSDMMPASLMSTAAVAPPPPPMQPYYMGPIPAPQPVAAPGAPAPNFNGGPRSAEVRRWWLETNLSYFEGIRRQFNDADLNIECFVGNNWETDEELRRDFDVARALGCRFLGRPYGLERVTRMAREAEKQKFPIYIHNEIETEPYLLQAMAVSPIVWLNFDVGNYTASGGANHLEILRQHHDRISHLHLKARNRNGDFVEFGQSESPVGDVVRLMRDQRYTFVGMIENERASRQVRARIPNVEPTLVSTGIAVEYIKKVLA